MNKMNGKLKALIIVLGFLLMLQAVPMIQPVSATDGFTYPGVNGAPPIVEERDDYTYQVHSIPYSGDPYTPLDDGWFNLGLVTNTEFDQELYLDGPVKWVGLSNGYNNEYVIDDTLVFEKIGLYCPVFLLEREQWYSHEFSLETSLSETLTFKIEGGFSGKKGPVSVGVSGSYETSTTTETSSGWGIDFDSSFGTAESLTVYIYMEFLRVYGSVEYYDGSEIEYDAIILERMDLDDFHYAPDAQERPDIDATAFLDKDDDGADYRTTMGEYREYSYDETKDVSWGLGFDLKLGPDVFNFGMEGSFECSTSTSLSLKHKFVTYSEGDDYIGYRNLPDSVHGFWISVGSFFSINLKMNHSVSCTPSMPSIDIPASLDVYELGEFSATAIDPSDRDLYYVFHWGDGQKTITGYVESGLEVTVNHTYTEPGHRMVIVEARNYYGEANEALESLDILRLEPDLPDAPVGPASGLQDFAYCFNFVTEDDHNQRILYEIDWGDGTVEQTEYSNSGQTITRSHTWTTGSVSGIPMQVSVRAQNEDNGRWSEWSDSSEIVISKSVPNVPTIGGPDSLYVNEDGDFWVRAYDPSGLQMRYIFHFSDGYSWTSDWVDSGTKVTISHDFSTIGTKMFWADARNTHTVTTTCDPILISVRENVAPVIPDAPEGPSSGYEGNTYTFVVSTSDIDGDNIRYEFDFGDGSTVTTGYYSSGVEATIQHSWDTGSLNGFTYNVKVRAQDSLGHWSGWSSTASIVVKHSVPNVPSIGNPSSLRVGTSGSFWAESVDPAGVQVRYKFFWSDGTSWTSAWVNSGTRVTTTHSFSTIGIKSYWVETTNAYGQKSTADPNLFSVYNSAPNTPGRPSGPSTGYTGKYYTFSFGTTDPEGHTVRYQVSWGDGTTTTTGYYSSGSTVSRSHSWRTSVTGGMYYYVKVRAQDSLGAWSSWSSSKAILIKPSSSGGGPIIMSANPLSSAQLDVVIVGISEQISPVTETVCNTGNTTSDLEAILPRFR